MYNSIKCEINHFNLKDAINLPITSPDISKNTTASPVSFVMSHAASIASRHARRESSSAKPANGSTDTVTVVLNASDCTSASYRAPRRSRLETHTIDVSVSVPATVDNLLAVARIFDDVWEERGGRYLAAPGCVSEMRQLLAGGVSASKLMGSLFASNGFDVHVSDDGGSVSVNSYSVDGDLRHAGGYLRTLDRICHLMVERDVEMVGYPVFLLRGLARRIASISSASKVNPMYAVRAAICLSARFDVPLYAVPSFAIAFEMRGDGLRAPYAWRMHANDSARHMTSQNSIFDEMTICLILYGLIVYAQDKGKTLDDVAAAIEGNADGFDMFALSYASNVRGGARDDSVVDAGSEASDSDDTDTGSDTSNGRTIFDLIFEGVWD